MGVQTGTWDPLPILWTFASLGILAMIPNVANMIKSLMAGKGAGEMKGGIGEIMALPAVAFGYGMKGVSTLTDIGRAYSTRFGFGGGGTRTPETGQVSKKAPIPSNTSSPVRTPTGSVQHTWKPR
jgi:hypothetical protein